MVSTFLHQLLDHLHPQAVQELRSIEVEKSRDREWEEAMERQQRRTGGAAAEQRQRVDSAASSSTPPPPSSSPPLPSVAVWDAAYYMGRMKATAFDLDDRVLSQFFTLRGCMQVGPNRSYLTALDRRISWWPSDLPCSLSCCRVSEWCLVECSAARWRRSPWLLEKTGQRSAVASSLRRCQQEEGRKRGKGAATDRLRCSVCRCGPVGTSRR